MGRIGTKLIKDNVLQVTSDQLYWEVDIEYTTQAKMVLLGKDEDDIKELLAREFSDIPNLNILNINEASPELVNEAKSRRAADEAHMKTLN